MDEGSSKTYMFGSDNNLLTALIPLLTQRGMDPSILALLNNSGGLNGNNFIWVLFLLFFFWRGGNGNFGNTNATDFITSQLNNDTGRDLLLQAIQGNGSAISSLATTLSCDVNAIQSSVNGVLSAIQTVGSQVGMSGLQIQNAIQSGNAAIASQLAQCCCDNRLLTTEQGYQAQLRTVEQTGTLSTAISAASQRNTDSIADLKTTMVKEFCDARERDMQEKIDGLLLTNNTLRGQIDNASQTAQITGYINSLVAPLQAQVNNIASKQLPTVPVQYPNIQAVNATPYGGGFGFGFGGGFNPWGYGFNGSSYWG